MTIVYLILAILIVGFAYEKNRILGAMLLIVVVLGLWLAAYRKGII